MISSTLTLIGLFLDIIGFAFAWREYNAASRDAAEENRVSKRESDSLLKPIDPIAFKRGVHVSYMDKGKTVKTESFQEPVKKSAEQVRQEESARAAAIEADRASRLDALSKALLARRAEFAKGAWLVLIGFIFQFLGALPFLN